MAHAMTIPIVGALTLVGVGAGIHLGNAAIGEINPMYFSEPETRFHADLSPYRPSDSPRRIVLAKAGDPALGTGCVGCRTYPEEYYPTQDPAVEPFARTYSARAEIAPETAAPAIEQQADPEAVRLQGDIQRVQRYAAGGAETELVYASAEAEAPVEAAAEQLPAN